MKKEHFDVLIIGAGPAGSSAAIYFRSMEPRLRVGIIDKRAFPRDKACGDGLGPGVINHLMKLGVNIEQIVHANKIHTAEVHGPNEISFRTNISNVGDNVFGITSRRVDFDDMLYQRAVQVGIEYYDQTRYINSNFQNGLNEVVLVKEKNKEEVRFSCKLLVGADGASSRVRRSAGVAPNPPQRTGIAIRAYAKIPSKYSDRIIISFEDHIRPGYGWCFPFADNTANVGVGMVISDFRKVRPQLVVCRGFGCAVE